MTTYTDRMKHLIIAALAPFTLSSCNVQPTASIAVYGDSVSWGYGDFPLGGWVRKVSQKTGYTFTNLAVPGERADGAAGRIDVALRSAPNASVVMVLHGGNDWIKAFRSSWCNRICDPAVVDEKYQSIGEHLRSISQAIHDRGKRAVFLTYWPTSLEACPQYDAKVWEFYNLHRMRLNAEILEVAAERGDIALTTYDLEEMGKDVKDFSDCLHPSSQGYERIANRILKDQALWAPADEGPDTPLHYIP